MQKDVTHGVRQSGGQTSLHMQYSDNMLLQRAFIYTRTHSTHTRTANTPTCPPNMPILKLRQGKIAVE